MTNTKSTFVRKIKRMSRKAPVRIVAVVLMVALVMNVSSVVTLLPVFAGNNTATTVQGDSPTASVTNDDLQISGRRQQRSSIMPWRTVRSLLVSTPRTA